MGTACTWGCTAGSVLSLTQASPSSAQGPPTPFLPTARPVQGTGVFLVEHRVCIHIATPPEPGRWWGRSHHAGGHQTRGPGTQGASLAPTYLTRTTVLERSQGRIRQVLRRSVGCRAQALQPGRPGPLPSFLPHLASLPPPRGLAVRMGNSHISQEQLIDLHWRSQGAPSPPSCHRGHPWWMPPSPPFP